VLSVPGSIKVVRSLCGLLGGKQHHFGHFYVWFSGPERADHARTDIGGFGLVVLFHCSFLVCIYVFLILVGSTLFCTLLYYIYNMYIASSIIYYCSYVWFVVLPFIVFVILTDPRVAGEEEGMVQFNSF
jgi:hypothetical protein